MNLTAKEKESIADGRRRVLASFLEEAASHIRSNNWLDFHKCMERADKALRLAEEAK